MERQRQMFARTRSCIARSEDPLASPFAQMMKRKLVDFRAADAFGVAICVLQNMSRALQPTFRVLSLVA